MNVRVDSNVRSFRNWPLVMRSVPRVRRPSSAWLPCCWAVDLSIGAPGTLTALGSSCCVCQAKSWSRLPSFLDNKSCFACLTTSRTSATRAWPSGESLADGLESALDSRKLFNATSIWSFWCKRVSSRPFGACQGELELVLTEGALPSWKALTMP